MVSKGKKSVVVDQPFVVKRYNEYMGGTDKMDQNTNCYRIAVRTKQWWWPIFSWMVDVTVQNAWLIYRKEKVVSRIDYQAWVARTYLKQASN